MLCKYPARSRTKSPKNLATYKPAGNVTLSKKFVQRSDELIRGTRNRAGAAFSPQCVTEILNVGFGVAPQPDVNTALLSTK
jgi:hypothetical protein